MTGHVELITVIAHPLLQVFVVHCGLVVLEVIQILM